MIDPTQLRLLVVDDNEFARTAARTNLHKLGIDDVEVATTGAEAVGLLFSQSFDVLLTDWYMPDVTGAGLLQILRDPRVGCTQKNIPVIVMTAYANSENAAQAKQFDVTEIIVKPLDLPALRASLLKLTSRLNFRDPVSAENRPEDPAEDHSGVLLL